MSRISLDNEQGVCRARCTYLLYSTWPYWTSRSGELQTQKLKFCLVRSQSLNVLPLKSGVGQYIAIHATLTARDFFLTDFYPSGPFTCIFSQNLSQIFPALVVANTGSCVGPQNKIGHPAGIRFPCWVLAEYKQTPKRVLFFFWLCVPKLWMEFELWFERKTDLWYNDLWNE